MGCGNDKNQLPVGAGEPGTCVCQVVEAILQLQEAAEEECFCPTNCFLEPLGSLTSPARTHADTRVFILSTASGKPFHAFFRGAQNACVSIYFRVEEVFDNCCATLRVLIPGRMEGTTFTPVNLVSNANPCCIDLNQVCRVNSFRASDSCITVDLRCFCAIECVADVFLGICED